MSKQNDTTTAKVLSDIGALVMQTPVKVRADYIEGVVVGQKKSAEARLAKMQQTISNQQQVICKMREKLGVKGGVL